MKVISSVAAATLVLSSAAYAAAPYDVQFDAWTTSQKANQGEIDITLDYDPNTADAQTCPAGFQCSGAITGDGFLQRTITHIASGDVFFHTIVTDAGTGRTMDVGRPDEITFSDESFVRSGNIDGIADKQHIRDTENRAAIDAHNPASAAIFVANTELSTGWAAGGAGGTDLKLYQAVIDTKKEGFRTDFWFAQTATEANQRMEITSRVGLSGTFGVTATQDFQDFAFASLKGSYTNSTGNVTIPGSGVMEWTNGEHIAATYVGQDLDQAIGQTFVFEGYDNLSTKTFDLVSTFSLSATIVQPTYWDDAVWGPIDAANPNPPWY